MTKSVRDDFPVILRRSIQAGIVSIFGHSTALAVEFYLDSSLATKDIIAYTRSLEKLFTAGSKVIEDSCAQHLYQDLGLSFHADESYRLNDYVEDAKKKLGLDGGTTESSDEQRT